MFPLLHNIYHSQFEMLHFTSLFFSTVVIHAYFIQRHDAFLLFIAVSNLSILYHSLKDNTRFNETNAMKMIMFLDILFARISYLYFSYVMLSTRSIFSIFIAILFAQWTIVIYGPFSPTSNEMLHGLFHFTSSLAMHLFLYSASRYP